MSEGHAEGSDAIDPRFQALVDNVDIFHGLRAKDVEKIFSRGMTMYVEKDDTVFHKNTEGNKMYVVLGGSIGIFDGPVQMATLRTGDTFGEMSLLTGMPRVASAVALERCNLFTLDEPLFQKLLTKRVAVQMLLNIARMLGGRLKDANRTIRELEDR
ncbi:MAG: cyclic nucleotide-binding domain-containing protein [Candidatus Hydrogenedentes bacterium]|nr:cyclic nucleotide-binding domain-containing protein [Candidatus Hydrogenedentota bacterium]